MYQPASHLLLQNSDVSTTQGDSGGSLATPQWGEVAGVPNVTGGAAVSKLYQTYLKSKHDTIHKKWTRWEKDIFFFLNYEFVEGVHVFISGMFNWGVKFIPRQFKTVVTRAFLLD